VASGTPLWKFVVPASVHLDKSAVLVMRESLQFHPPRLLKLIKLNNQKEPVDRISTLFAALINQHFNFPTDKPFNPILGEFIHEKLYVHDGDKVIECDLVVEQISHHPPIVGYRIKGPGFCLQTKEGIDDAKSFKFGFNHLEISYLDSIVQITTDDHLMEWCQPSIRINNIIFGKRDGFLHGEFFINDYDSGMYLKGTFSKGWKFKGAIYNADDSIYVYVDGDFIKGLYLKNKKVKWVEPIQNSVLKSIVPDYVLEDPHYTENVWKDVFIHMRQSPPAFANADKHKGIVENTQRAVNKDRKIPFVSRFGLDLADKYKTKEE
jgi:hypothetical protein